MQFARSVAIWAQSKGGLKGKGKGTWQIDGDEAPGDFDWSHPAKEQPHKETTVVDQEGFQVVNRSHVSGNFMPDIFVVDRVTSRGTKTIPRIAGFADHLGITGFADYLGINRFANQGDIVCKYLPGFRRRQTDLRSKNHAEGCRRIKPIS